MPTMILRRTGHKKTVRRYELQTIFVEPSDEEKASGKATFFLHRPEEEVSLIFTTAEIRSALSMLRDVPVSDTEPAARNNASGLHAYARFLGYSFTVVRSPRKGFKLTLKDVNTGEIAYRDDTLGSEADALLAAERWLDDKKMERKVKVK